MPYRLLGTIWADNHHINEQLADNEVMDAWVFLRLGPLLTISIFSAILRHEHDGQLAEGPHANLGMLCMACYLMFQH